MLIGAGSFVRVVWLVVAESRTTPGDKAPSVATPASEVIPGAFFGLGVFGGGAGGAGPEARAAGGEAEAEREDSPPPPPPPAAIGKISPPKSKSPPIKRLYQVFSPGMDARDASAGHDPGLTLDPNLGDFPWYVLYLVAWLAWLSLLPFWTRAQGALLPRHRRPGRAGTLNLRGRRGGGVDRPGAAEVREGIVGGGGGDGDGGVRAGGGADERDWIREEKAGARDGGGVEDAVRSGSGSGQRPSQRGGERIPS